MRKSLLVPSFALALSASALVAGAAEKPAPPKMKPALVVMDVQNVWLPYMDERDKKIGMGMLNHVIALFRDNGFPVVRVYHTDPERGPAPGTEAFAFPENVAVRDDDPMIVKNYPSAFKKTDLDRLLREKGVNTVFLVGLSAVGCVLSTYHGGADLDYNVFMVEHALISHDAELTASVYEICSTVSYEPLKLLLETARAQ